ncbi:hypothetical protein FACS189499_07430 [Clostridia bacterium]|nr:hypothetical protein FACS189499_07430 [Clostridia bacterium]
MQLIECCDKYFITDKIRKFTTILAIILVVTWLLSITCSAYLFYSYDGLTTAIKANVYDANTSFKNTVNLMTIPPFDTTFGVYQQGIITTAEKAVQTFAMSLATLLFLIEFLKKSMEFHWVSKWENIIIFLAKMFVAKTCVQNVSAIMRVIFGLFNGLLRSVTRNTFIDLLPEDDEAVNMFLTTDEIAKLSQDGGWQDAGPLLKWCQLMPLNLIM